MVVARDLFNTGLEPTFEDAARFAAWFGSASHLFQTWDGEELDSLQVAAEMLCALVEEPAATFWVAKLAREEREEWVILHACAGAVLACLMMYRELGTEHPGRVDQVIEHITTALRAVVAAAD